MIPDITGMKVLPPVIIFTLFSFGLLSEQSVPVRMLAMTIALTAIYKFILRLTYTPADIVVPAVLFALLSPGRFFTLPGTSVTSPAVIISHSIVYAFAFASLRGFFPQFY